MLIIIDIETTGIKTEDKIVSIGLINVTTQEIFYEVVNEGKRISPKASSVHHITNEQRKENLALEKSEVYKYLQKYNSFEHILIAHNLDFTLSMLLKSGFSWKGETISTKRVTKHLIPECEDFALQILQYELQLYKLKEQECESFGIKDALHAHHALGDAVIVKLLFDYLLSMQDEKKLVALSMENVLIQKFDFGKHKGKFIEEVSYNDRNYLEWMLLNMHDLDEDIRYSINYYLQGIS